jgi:hypothetical protein
VERARAAEGDEPELPRVSLPADCGPLRSEPAASMVASELPPAPIVTPSIDGKTIGCPYSTYHSLVVRSSPSWISEMSVLVPPMSRPIALSNPAVAAVWRAATAPAAIPEAARRTAYCCTASASSRRRRSAG